MKIRPSLRNRIVGAALGLAAVISAGFAIGVFTAFDIAEGALFTRHVEQDAETFVSQYLLDPDVARLPRSNFRAYVVENGDDSKLPPALKQPPDDDEVIIDGVEFRLLRKEAQGTRFYFLFDESAFEEFESVITLGVWTLVALALLISAWLSFLLASRVIRPVTELASEVSAAHRTESDVAADHSIDFDELGVLRQAFHDYQQRLDGMLAREREFSADVSHELRSPLMALSSAAENLLGQEDGSARTADLARRILRYCEQMNLMIEALLYMARDPIDLEQHLEKVDVVKVVSEQLEFVEDMARAKQLQIEFRKRASPVISGSRQIVSIIVGNLIRNAVKHTHQGTVEVSIDDGAVTVSDTGPGISQSDRSAVFERFYSSAPEAGRGIGIGLSLVQRFCRQVGWTLDLQPNHPRGTVATVAFGVPARNAAAPS